MKTLVRGGEVVLWKDLAHGSVGQRQQVGRGLAVGKADSWDDR